MPAACVRPRVTSTHCLAALFLQLVFNQGKSLAREVQLTNSPDLNLSIIEPLTGNKVRASGQRAAHGPVCLPAQHCSTLGCRRSPSLYASQYVLCSASMPSRPHEVRTWQSLDRA